MLHVRRIFLRIHHVEQVEDAVYGLHQRPATTGLATQEPRLRGGFTDRYNCDRLVYYERLSTPQGGINREKELKGWKRIRKLALIVEQNPTWRDLSEDWGKPARLTWRPPNA
jgi:predicted GIY-YIG superfamily endonuclease